MENQSSVLRDGKRYAAEGATRILSMLTPKLNMKCQFSIATLLLLSMLVLGCSVSGKIVQYDGDTLIVKRKRYPRKKVETAEYAPGQIIVGYEAERLDELLKLLETYSLEETDDKRSKHFLQLKVPIDFEHQWIEALSKEESVKHVGLNHIIRIPEGPYK